VKTTKWADIKASRFSPARLAEIRAEAEDELVTLSELRKAAGLTQVEVSKRSGIDQGELSRLERRIAPRIETVARYVEALGGQIEVNAVFGGKRVRVKIG
jgi:predicted transcriptional regulator